MKISGRCWVFGDHVNTDAMYPHESFVATPEQRRAQCMRSIRPDWSRHVSPGDLLVAGTNFGTGSGRPAPQVLHDLGIRGVIAESVAGLFYRGCVNAALPILECPEVTQLATEGDELVLDLRTGTVTAARTGGIARGEPMPAPLLDIIVAGGVVERLMKGGYLESEPPM